MFFWGREKVVEVKTKRRRRRRQRRRRLSKKSTPILPVFPPSSAESTSAPWDRASFTSSRSPKRAPSRRSSASSSGDDISVLTGQRQGSRSRNCQKSSEEWENWNTFFFFFSSNASLPPKLALSLSRARTSPARTVSTFSDCCCLRACLDFDLN